MTSLRGELVLPGGDSCPMAPPLVVDTARMGSGGALDLARLDHKRGPSDPSSGR